jgi:hypothetical protein
MVRALKRILTILSMRLFCSTFIAAQAVNGGAAPGDEIQLSY